MKEKYCPKCRTTKPVSEFYKKKSSSDGLQYYCKKCQDGYNKCRPTVSTKNQTKSGTPRGLHFKRLSNYHLYHGLEYSLKGKLKKHHYRNTVTYKCLTCGKEFTTDLDTAWSYRYNCEDCVCLIPGLPTTELRKPSSFKPTMFEHIPEAMPQCANHKSKKVKEEIFTATWNPELTDEYNNHECLECKHNCEDCSEQAENDPLIEKIKELRKKATKNKTSQVHVIILEVPKIQTVPVTTEVAKDSLWTKIKKLFHCS